MPKRINILHLEDEPNDAELVQQAIDGYGIACRVEAVAARDEFAAALDQGGIDIILSDYSLPGFDGLSALRLAQEKAPNVPFIFVSGTLGEESAIESLRSGATDYVLKHRLSRLAPAVKRAVSEAAERNKRMQAEEGLQNEQQFLKAVLDSLAEGIVACNSDGVLTLFNRAARDFHGLPEIPIPTDQWAEHYGLYHPDGKTPMKRESVPLFRALQGERLTNVELVIKPKNGSPRTVLTSGQAITDARGRKFGAVVAMHDITDRKQLENQLRQTQKMEAIGRLAGGVAHDFNNFLTAIMGHGQLLGRRLRPNDPGRQDTDEIQRAAERAASLTRQLLAFSRQQALQPRPLVLNEAIAEMGKMLKRLIGADIDLLIAPGA